ncbi:MAG: protein-export chaperone SecB [Fermentimonas sp.]|nr:protein-export chaperone SecB [Fermentimonas sp.]
MKAASFSLSDYSFDKVSIDYSKKTGNEISIDFDPKGLFKLKDESAVFELTFVFNAIDKVSAQQFINIECHAIFTFAEVIAFDDIPEYFYGNSIAILFPYIRAFISTVTLQANLGPFVLPTMNLSSLEEPLRKNTTVE